MLTAALNTVMLRPELESTMNLASQAGCFAIVALAIGAASMGFAQSSLTVNGGVVRLGESSVELDIADAGDLRNGAIRLPRLNNPIGNVYLDGDAARTPLQIAPQVSDWIITLPPGARTGQRTVILETIGVPRVAGKPRVASAAANGVITLAACDALTHGTTLRYEPQLHKNTVGYWSRVEDWCEWHFTSERPGRYDVWILQGCGKGQGGSEVVARIGERDLPFTVEETGHFQNFKSRRIGEITLDEPGRHQLELRPKSKAAAAVMDVRQVRLIPLDAGP
jgi:hypothetical protein